MNLNRYFLHERPIFLDNISFEAMKPAEPGQPMKLGCKDTIVAQRSELGVKLTFNRTMAFEPEGLFRLLVTYGVMLTFDPSTKNEVDWDGLDIAREFRKSCGGTLTALMSRTSLMIGQITAAAGQNPIITPAAAPIDSTGAVSNS